MTIPNQNPLGYAGLKETNPPNIRILTRDPTVNDYVGFDIGDFWINKTTRISWQLLSKAGGIADWQAVGGGAAQVSGLEGDDAVVILPNAGVIQILGSNGITTSNSAPSTMEIANNSTVTTDDANATSYVAGNLLFTNTNGLTTTQVGAGNIGVGIDAPVSIANGGTNAVAMGTNTGIVKYDGTSLVTSTTALIDAGNIYTNTSQPAFFAYLNATTGAVTGDGTYYTVLFNATTLNVGACYNTGTGIFTAPKTGLYSFSTSVLLNSLTATNTDFIIFLQGSVYSFRVLEGSAATFQSVTAEISGNGSMIVPMTAGDTMTVQVFVIGSAGKDAKVFGGALPGSFSSFSGCLLC